MKKTALITGSTSGLGRALATELANQGYSLVLCGRRKEALDQLVEELPTDQGQTYHLLHFDLAEPQDYDQLLQSAVDALGSIFYLILNAGLSQKGFFEKTRLEVEATLWQVNYQSAVSLTRAWLPQAIEQGSGQIVAVGSIAGRYGAPYLTTYSATKHALYGFFESLRYEVEKHQIGVLLVTPGFIKTDVAKKALDETGQAANQDSKAQANGIPPERAARKIANSMTKKSRHSVVIAGKEVVFLYLRRLSPKLFYHLIKKLHGL
ncbi:MAG: SDR family NAD(P)-dependent oxidoreductase [Bacteroidota bacterium]